MDFAQNNVSSSHCTIQNISELAQEKTYKECLLSSVWAQSRLVASLLDQIGLTYHRVFNHDALELFLLLINTELTHCHALPNFNVNTLSELSEDLLSIQTKLISSMDSFVVETLKNSQVQAKKTQFFKRLFGHHNQWQHCAKSRFEQVISPVLELKLIRNK